MAAKKKKKAKKNNLSLRGRDCFFICALVRSVRCVIASNAKQSRGIEMFEKRRSASSFVHTFRVESGVSQPVFLSGLLRSARKDKPMGYASASVDEVPVCFRSPANR